eukprot:gene9308-9120_t
MRRFSTVLILCAAALSGAPAVAADIYVQCEVKLALPGGRLEARITGDAKGFNSMGEAAVIVPVAKEGLIADPPHAFDLADPAGQTAEYRVNLRYEWIGDSPPPPFSKAGAKHPWWPVGDQFIGPPLPASATPDKDWTYAAWGSNGVQIKGGDYIYMTGRDTPHRASLGVAYQRSENQAQAYKQAQERIAFVTALAGHDSFVLVFLTRENARLGAAQVDATLLKAIPDLSDRAYEEAARMRKAGKCLVSKV